MVPDQSRQLRHEDAYPRRPRDRTIERRAQLRSTDGGWRAEHPANQGKTIDLAVVRQARANLEKIAKEHPEVTGDLSDANRAGWEATMGELTGDDEGIFAASTAPRGDLSVVFEDDGETAYGYLLLGGEIISHVWIYNHGRAVRAKDAHAPPDPVESDADVSFVWDDTNVVIKIRGRACARLAVGTSPGWCVFVGTDGPRARAWGGTEE